MRKNIIEALVVGIGILVIVKVLSSTFLYFNDEEAIVFFSYLFEKNDVLDVSNATIWIFLTCSIVITYLNKVDSNKREG